MQILKKLLFLLNSREKKQASILLALILLMAIIDTLGVASILPFVAVLSNPELIETNLMLNKMFKYSKIFGVENNQEFLFVLGLFVFILLVVSLLIKALTTYAQFRFTIMREYSIGKLLIERYLHQPYIWFLDRHSADLGKNILSEVGTVVGSGLKPFIELVAKSIVSIFLIILLILANPILTLIVGLSLSSSYGLIFYLSRNYLVKIGKTRMQNNELRFKAIIEAFSAVKEIKVSGIEKVYIERFSNPAEIYAFSKIFAATIIQLPRFFLEIVAFGGILLLLLYFINQSGNLIDALPIISLYIFAGYRLMPALQQIYISVTQLANVGPTIDKLYNDIINLNLSYIKKNDGNFLMKKNISLKKVYFNYPKTSKVAIKDININIPAKNTVAIVGPTGSGKTTTVDIILGLLEPQKGGLTVDDKTITRENKRLWQKSIGYVPQNIFLSDDTISANIAFGEDIKDINKETVEKVAKIANLHDFVSNDLPEKYETKIGERGVKLSGGQRQRIGIARALYHQPQVLILDEATSALDNSTEKAVMDALNNLKKNITIIIIAHRLNTIKNCDTIFFLENGKLKNQGTFEELLKLDKNFRINAKT